MKKIHTIFKAIHFHHRTARLRLKQLSFYLQSILIMTERIKQLEQFIEEDPSDPFNYYALALEYSNLHEHKALSIFEQLAKEKKDYLPVYYQLAKLYAQMGRRDNAVQTFNAGITVAKNQNDTKTLRELRAALEELLND